LGLVEKKALRRKCKKEKRSEMPGTKKQEKRRPAEKKELQAIITNHLGDVPAARKKEKMRRTPECQSSRKKKPMSDFKQANGVGVNQARRTI